MKKIAFLLLLLVAAVGYLLFKPARNYDTAYIEKMASNYLVTVKGKRLLMVHDPISLLQKSTYVDSLQFIVPRAEGIIDGLEIPVQQGYYKFVQGNAMVIKQGTLEINMFYHNSDDNRVESSGWNGFYKLVWRKSK